MPSRTARKRYRRRLASGRSKATAESPTPLAGGFGEGAKVSRSDWLLVRRAIREQWQVPAAIRELLAARTFESLNQDNLRMVGAALQVAMAMEGDNLLHTRLDRWATHTARPLASHGDSLAD